MALTLLSLKQFQMHSISTIMYSYDIEWYINNDLTVFESDLDDQIPD